jgi:hypothetical protein
MSRPGFTANLTASDEHLSTGKMPCIPEKNNIALDLLEQNKNNK